MVSSGLGSPSKSLWTTALIRPRLHRRRRRLPAHRHRVPSACRLDARPAHADLRPIVNDKLLAYSYILTHEGYPCVFWKDYFNYELALEGTQNGIAALVQAHEKYAGGATNILYVDDNLYIMERSGFGEDPGLVYVLNNRGDNWNGRVVTTQWSSASFQPVAWWSKLDMARPISQSTDLDGRAQFYAPPRGYAVYAIK